MLSQVTVIFQHSHFTADSHLQIFFLTVISRSYLFFSEKSSQKFSFFGNSVKSLAAAKSISKLHALKTKKIKSVKLLKSDFICFAYKIPDKYWKNQLPYYFQLNCPQHFFPGTCFTDIGVWSAIHIFCQRHYKMKFDIDPGYIFQTALTILLFSSLLSFHLWRCFKGKLYYKQG